MPRFTQLRMDCAGDASDALQTLEDIVSAARSSHRHCFKSACACVRHNPVSLQLGCWKFRPEPRCCFSKKTVSYRSVTNVHDCALAVTGTNYKKRFCVDAAVCLLRWSTACGCFNIADKSYLKGLDVGSIPQAAPQSIPSTTLFTIFHGSQIFVICDGIVAFGGPRMLDLLARHGIDVKLSVGPVTRAQSRERFDNLVTHRKQQPSAKLEYAAKLQGFEYDCGDYKVKIATVHIKGNYSHNVLLEVDFLAASSTCPAPSAEKIAKEILRNAFGSGADGREDKVLRQNGQFAELEVFVVLPHSANVCVR